MIGAAPLACLTAPGFAAQQRLRDDWVYMGPEARTCDDLASDQVGYAITMRRQEALSLARTAARRAIGDLTPTGRLWASVSRACRTEARRCDKHLQRLAAKAGRA